MHFKCDNCKKQYTINENKIKGETAKIRCKECKEIIIIRKHGPELEPQSIYSSPQLSNSEMVDDKLSQVKGPKTKSKGNGFKLRAKFNIAMGVLFLVCVICTYFIAGSRLQREAENQIFDKARLLLVTMESSRSFTSKVIKPVLYKALPGRFIVEGMSSSFGARNIFERISKSYPQYYFKHAAPNPRNPINKANAVEMDVINKFQADPGLKEWKGFTEINGEKKYMIMKPIVAREACLRCHGVADLAPIEMVERYGPTNGFGRRVGEVIGTLTVSVPASVVMDAASRNTFIFITIVLSFFIVLALLINFLFGRVILQPINNLSEIADKISIGELNTKVNVSGNDEISNLAESFERMRASIKIAFSRMK